MDQLIGIALSESELQMFGQLFTYYDSDNSGIVPQSVAKQLLNSSQLEPKVLEQIGEMSGCSRGPGVSGVSRQQFYAMLKLVGAAQSGLPLSTDTLNTNPLTLCLPQLSPIGDTNKHQLMANIIDDYNKSETTVQMTGHLPPPPAKPSVRSNRRNNKFLNSDNFNRQPIDTSNNYNILNNNNNSNNNNINNHINTEQIEVIDSGSSSTDEVNDDSPIDPILDKSYDYRDKSWSEFNDKTKDKPINWADFDEEHHLLENEDEDEDEEDQEGGGGGEGGGEESIKSDVSSEDDTFDIWNITDEQRLYYTNQFKAMQKNLNGIITGNKAKDFFEKSCLPIQELSQIWQLSDVDKDGALTLNEFCIAMHLVVLRRNNVELPAQLPPSLMPPKSPIDSIRVSSLNSNKCSDLGPNCEQLYNSVSPQQHNDLNEVKAKNVETLSPQNKQWTKFTDSPTNQFVVTAVSPPSTSSSAGLQALANFDFNAASIVKDPKILHPVALRLSPDGQPILYENNETNNHNIQSASHSVHSISVSEPIRSSTVAQGKKDPPPPPPPRPQRSHGHTRSSSLDLNKIIVRSGAANDLITSQIPNHLKISNSEYGLTAPQREFPALSLNSKSLGAFHAYKKTRAETSLTNSNNNNNSWIESLKLKYKLPVEVPAPTNGSDSTELWQTIRCLQDYNKLLMNINNDLLLELIRVTEDKQCLESRLEQLNNGCKL